MLSCPALITKMADHYTYVMYATSHLSTAAADRYTAFCKMDWSRGEQPGGFIQGRSKGMFLPQNVEKDSGAHAASYSMGAGVHFRG